MSDREFEYRIDYDERFARHVKEGNVYPLTGIKILADGVDLTGAPADSDVYYVDEYVNYHLQKILSALPEIQEGERRELGLYNQSAYLVVQPENDHVKVAYASNTELDDLADDDFQVVENQAFREGIVTAAEEFYDHIVDLNPELADHEEIKPLAGLLEDVR